MKDFYDAHPYAFWFVVFVIWYSIISISESLDRIATAIKNHSKR